MDRDFLELRKLAMRSNDRELRQLVGLDDMESEQADLFDSAENTVSSEYAAALQQQRAYWDGVAKRNRQGSQFAAATGRFASPTAVASNSARAADSKPRYSIVAANARSASQYSAFDKRY